MNSKTTLLLLTLVCVFIANAYADNYEPPKKAVCRTCEMRGSTHGDEDVAAWREYQGMHYFFCAQDCAKAFDDFPDAYIDHPIPRPAPNATVIALGGDELQFGDLKGQVVLLDFWATWCKPCRKSMPMLGELQTKWKNENFTVVGVSIDQNAAEVVPKFVEKHKLDYPIALDTTPRPAWFAYHVAAIPAMFLIDTDGRIVAEWRGEVDANVVRKAVEGLLTSEANAPE